MSGPREDLRPWPPWKTPADVGAVPEGTSGPVPPGVQSAGGSMPTQALEGSGGGVPPGFQRSLPSPWEVKPPGAQDVQRTGILAGATTATTTPPAVVTGCRFTVPGGSYAFLRSFDLQVNSLLTSSDVSFFIYVDGNALPGWDAIRAVPASLAVWIKSYGPDEIYLRVDPGKVVDFRVAVRDGGIYTVGASMHGWTVAQGTVDSYLQGYG